MRKQLTGFLLIGGISFFIDTGFLQLFVILGLGPYWGRFLSFSFALILSWWMNRTYSFGLKSKPTVKEFLSYIVSISLGGLINWLVYIWILQTWLDGTEFPALAIIPATAISMIFNFVSMKFLIFKKAS